MTAQTPDFIIIENKEYSLPDFVRENEFVSIDDSRIIHKPRNDTIMSTACHRHYVATWEIIDDLLYLVKINGDYSALEPLPFFADWITGTLVVPKEGKMLGRIAYWIVYEEELHIEVKNGVIQKTTVVDNRTKYSEEDFKCDNDDEFGLNITI